jgi:glycosyltransferase involved in cell wall biosynthesis
MNFVMTYNTRLGICIPTYKRPDQLRQCVVSVIAAAEPFQVPIFLADDSADETNAAVVAELQARYPHIIYEKNVCNLGIDSNILHCADICSCDYAWLLGEDDRLRPEAVATVLPILERDAPAFLAVNYSYVDQDIAILLRPKLLAIDTDTTMDSATFFQNTAWAIGFIGACVVNKSRWATVSPTPYLGTYFAHVGVILESIAGQNVFLLAAPLVLNRVGGADVFTWSGDAYGVFAGFPKVARLLAPIYGTEAAEAAAASFIRQHGLDTLRFMLAKRADRAYNIAVYREFVKDSDRSRLSKWAAYLVARLPPHPFRGLRALLYFIRLQRNRKVAQMDS